MVTSQSHKGIDSLFIRLLVFSSQAQAKLIDKVFKFTIHDPSPIDI